MWTNWRHKANLIGCPAELCFGFRLAKLCGEIGRGHKAMAALRQERHVVLCMHPPLCLLCRVQVWSRRALLEDSLSLLGYRTALYQSAGG
ncbi:hypothetical protein CBR_g18891 [Chara braunii]|uniref:Uncharacterized protein n=1 Tax=Chara braunii TaxID=69332 RepID=A0A388KWR6_CHABU|nr:hypothetical protein CBR_g18891 [Chara braunii]|eukprot:GBG74481.1 hypothetical protein CBR_g18891 [Chara braunii]